MRIERLSEEVIQKIAAGEVVDRPASALKELVENSLDARAETIRVELEGGGIELLRVDDDGLGMTPEEMRLAIERHTTSKLRTEEDLRHVRTLGFRGEALAAICAVSKVRLVSRAREASEAHEIQVEGGRIREDRPAARAVGTTVEVADLFFNVPARRKFLDSPQAEARHALAALRRLALARPEVGFRATSEGREVLDVPRAKTVEARLAQIYGKTLVDRLIRVELAEPGMQLLGFFSPPELTRPTRVDQHLFLSGRPVRPGPLTVGIYQTYSRFLPRGAHPLFFLYLDVDPELVDVNVHPKKEEVRFRQEGAAMDLLRRAALRALGTAAPTWEGRPVSLEPRPETLTEVPEAGAVPLWTGHGEPGPRVLGQVRQSFILVEEEDGVEIVDQHVAHERVLFEQLRDGGEVPSQRFLVPVQVEVPFDRMEALEAAIPLLAKIGVELEPFGPGVFLLRGWPAPLADRQSRMGFSEPLSLVAERLLAGETGILELWREMACAAAIKAGEALSLAEQEALIRAWKATRDPARCPHGRPVAIKLTWEELTKKLGRV